MALALLPRLVAMHRYVTPDELIWVYRSIQFGEAALDGRWDAMVVAGHPGVTTMWLGYAGMTIHKVFAPALRDAYDWLTTMAVFTPDNVAAIQRLALLLDGGRVAVAVVNSLGVVGVYLLARRLWGQTTALVAALFLALDPFLAGLSGLFHVDGLSATFVTLSLLSLLIGLRAGEGGRSWPWLVMAGATAALAALSKTPTLLLLPVTGLALAWGVWADGDRTLGRRLASLARAGLVWLAAFLVVALALYPPLWAAPRVVLETLGGSANRHLDEALRETFFLGRAAFDPGPLFYPVVLLWRLSPVVWLSLIPAAGLFIAGRRSGLRPGRDWWLALLLALWAAGFLVAITPAAKKFDRYILPAVPSLLILAAVLWSTWAGRLARAGRWLLPPAVTIQAIYWAFFAAYPLAAYNPLVGGPRTAAAVLPAGWGEAISASGRWLAANQPEAAGRRAMAGITPSLAPFFPGQTLVVGWDDPATAHYQIVTLGGRQLNPTGWAAQGEGLTLAHVVRYGGLDQAWVYERPSPRAPVRPPPLAEPAIFDERLALIAYGQTEADDAVAIAIRWRRLAPLAADERFTLRLVIRDDGGNVWATQESDLLNEVAFYPPDWLADETGAVRYLLELPPGIPPATYRVTLSLIDSRTAGQLPVRAGDAFQGVVYTAGVIDAPLPEDVVSASRLQIPHFTESTWLDGRLRLLGHGDIPAEVLAGGELPIDLFWHVPTGTLPPGLQLVWQWRPVEGGETRIVLKEPLSRYDTGLWRTGETIQEKYRVPLPPGLAAGDYDLAVEPLSADGASLGVAHTLSQVRVNNIDRLYDVPMDVARPLLDDCFGETICLRGALLPSLTATPGQTLDLVLYWQALKEPPVVYTAFLHVLNEAGEIVLTADHWPGGLPSDIWDAGQVIEDRAPLALPVDLPPGDYRFRVGLYTADDGRRLPLDGSAADYLILPRTLTVLP